MNNLIKFPKGSIKKVSGQCIVLRGDDIDTDRIIPARFLKCVNFDNLGDQVFADDRKERKGTHPFDVDINQGSSILIVNKNFGCGSSREHAPQALLRWGIKLIIGESFAEIFYGNCLSIGIPCARMSELNISKLQKEVEQGPQENYEFDITSKILRSKSQSWNTLMEKGASEILISGEWDATSLLISQKSKIKSIAKQIPYLNYFEFDID